MIASRRVDVAPILDQAPLGRLQIQVALALFCISLLDGFDTQVIAFVAPSISADWGVPMARFGLIFSAGLLGTVVGAVLLGIVADRIGRKRVILGGLLEFALLTLACSFADSYGELLGLRFLAGLGLGAVLPNLFSIASEYAPARLRITMITFTLWGFPLGAVIGGSITASLIRSHGWPIAFQIGGIVPLVLLPLLIWALPESIRFLALKRRSPHVVAAILQKIHPEGRYVPSDEFVLVEEKVDRPGLGALFRSGLALGTVLLCSALFCSLVLTYLLVNWIPTVLKSAGVDLQVAVMGTVMLNFAGIVGSLLFSRLVARFNPLRVIGAGYLVGTAAVVAIGAVHAETGMLMTTIFLAGFFVIGAQLSLTAYIAAFYPTHIRATGTGFAQGVGRTGSLLGPLLGGYLLSMGVPQTDLFRYIALPALAAALCILSMYMNERRRAAHTLTHARPASR